ncbi:anti-sigma factor family protein [Saccharibacillus kuerlensis]|uniref:Zinc-finger domain-containing protein n=1 Tax=Saccharibacillus kuerlensis TaxID=459527 RepID=A0ABQ2KYB1_9BACL|nr:zf-HC2 domain-containing protein [Saccharibacillus kuerlensis]GGN96920.1 hypothetical protein GCM10010969_14320 [Saccharibacillus kuerlensis]
MKREEALEYMNRYLDHDLSEEETEALFRHLGDSPEAREDFEFLKRLSNKLESMPDVMPPISLVDSILPRLDELDPMMQPELPEAKPEKLSEMESRRMFGEETLKRRRASEFWRSTLGRAVAGTTAAVAVLSIFVATYEPKQMPTAEMSSTTAVSGATDDTLVPSGSESAKDSVASEITDPSMEAEPIRPETQPAPTVEAPVPDLETPDGDLPPADEESAQADNEGESNPTESAASAVPSPDSQPSEGTPVPSEQPSNRASNEGTTGGAEENSNNSNNLNNSNSPSSESPAGSAKDKEAANEPSANNSGTVDKAESGVTEKKQVPSDSKPKAETPAQDGSSAKETTGEEQQSKENASISSVEENVPESKEDVPAADKESENRVDENEAAENNISSLAIAAPEWNSPDGTLTVTYSRNVLKLLKSDRSSELGSRKVEGDVAGGVWSADGKTFTYDLIKADGTTSRETWKIEEAALKPNGK